jgi:hypothetical protein
MLSWYGAIFACIARWRKNTYPPIRVTHRAGKRDATIEDFLCIASGGQNRMVFGGTRLYDTVNRNNRILELDNEIS